PPQLLEGRDQERAADEAVEPEDRSGGRDTGAEREEAARQLNDEQDRQQPVERGAAHPSTLRRSEDRGNAPRRLATPYHPPVSQRTATLVATILGSSIVFLDGTIVNVALEAIGRDLPATFVGRLEGL